MPMNVTPHDLEMTHCCYEGIMDRHEEPQKH